MVALLFRHSIAGVILIFMCDDFLTSAYSFAQTKRYTYWKTYPSIVRI